MDKKYKKDKKRLAKDGNKDENAEGNMKLR